MSVRPPVVAGRFYPSGADALKGEVINFLQNNAQPGEKPASPWALMLPHAGYVFCGDVIGKTLSGTNLPSKLVIICPNHTGYGTALSVWPAGKWLTPLGAVKVDTELAGEILASNGGFQADMQAHAAEHSIEVILPFLQEQTKNLEIVPICVGTQNPQFLQHAGHALAHVLQKHPDVGIVVSSDMNHYENEKTTFAKDQLALDKACAADPDGLLQVVRNEKISMCGAGPLALALYTAKDLGRPEVELVAHDTSGKASGDYDHTVGYAGLRIFLR